MICVKEETYKETETTKWIGKHVLISVSISSNLIPEPNFLCNSDPRHLVSSFISALEGLAAQSKAQMELAFIERQTAIKIKLSRVLEQLNQRHSQRDWVFDYDNDEYFNDTAEEKELKELSTQILHLQKNQLIDLQEHFELYCNTLPVFGLNSAKYDIRLIKSPLLPIRCVNQCLLDCIQDGTMTLNLNNSCLDRTEHAPSKILSLLFLNKLVPYVGLKAMLQLVDK